MPRKYKLRKGEVGGEEYKPRRRNKKIQISEEEVKEVVSSTISATPPSMITSTPDVVMVEMSSTQGATTEVEKSVEEVEEAPSVESTQSTQIVKSTQKVEERREEFGWREYREKKRPEKEKKKKEPDRSRCFILTFNKNLEEACEKIKKEEAKYIRIGGIEKAPTTDHQHQHCVVYFKNARYANSMKNKYKYYGQVEAVKMMDKDIQRTLNYVIKEKDITFEKGNLPEQGFRSDLERQIKTHESINDLMMDRPDIYARNRNGIIDYYRQKEDNARLNEMFNECITGEIHNRKVNVVYIIGTSGSGKSTNSAKYAHDKFGYKAEDMGYIKFDDNFCNGRRIEAKCLFWHEFRSDQITPAGFYQICDKLGYSMNVKYGSVFIRPETIIFDSIIPLEEIFPSEDQRYQIYRRITNYVEYDKNHNFVELDDRLDLLRFESQLNKNDKREK